MVFGTLRMGARPSVPAAQAPSLLYLLPLGLVALALAQRTLALIINNHGVASLSLDSYCQWDCGWFTRIATGGYAAHNADDQGKLAFFPLLPLLMAAVRWLTGWTPASAGTAVAVVSTYCAAVLSRPLFGPLAAWAMFCGLVTIGPGSLYFLMPYSESLFLLLSVLLLRSLAAENHAGAAIAGALLSATRITGVVAVGMILLDAAQKRVARDGWRGLGDTLRRPAPVLAAGAAALGLLAYMAFLWWQFGDPLAFLHAESRWGRQIGNPLSALWSGLTFTPVPHVSDDRLEALAATASLGLGVVLLAQRRLAMALLVLATVLIPLSSGVGSMVRFTAGLAPLWLVVAETLAAHRVVRALAWPAMLILGFVFDLLWLATTLELI